MKAKWLAAIAAVSLVSVPAMAAAPGRALAPVSAQSSQVGGESFLPWAILVGILAGAAFAIIQEEDSDDDVPASAG